MKHLFLVDEATMAVTRLPDTNDNDLARLHELVGGYVEKITCAEGTVAWCDEDGGPKELPYTVAVLSRGGQTLFLRGNVVLVVERASSPEDSTARVGRIALPLLAFRNKGIAPPPSKLQ